MLPGENKTPITPGGSLQLTFGRLTGGNEIALFLQLSRHEAKECARSYPGKFSLYILPFVIVSGLLRAKKKGPGSLSIKGSNSTIGSTHSPVDSGSCPG